MRKLFCLSILMLIVLSCFGQSFVISTSQGPKQLTIPEGYTLEEAYCLLGQMYYEEKIEHDALIAKCDSLVTQVEAYVSQVDELNALNDSLNEDYKALNENYLQLSNLYDKMRKSSNVQGMLSLRTSKPYTGEAFELSAMAGVKFFSMLAFVDVGFNAFSVGVGFLF